MRLSPPSYEFKDGLYILLRPLKKPKSYASDMQFNMPSDDSRIPSNLRSLIMKEIPSACPWSLSGPQFPLPTGIQQRYCYPKGNPEYSSRKGGALYTLYNTNGKEDFEYRLLHVYFSAKRAYTSKHQNTTSNILRNVNTGGNVICSPLTNCNKMRKLSSSPTIGDSTMLITPKQSPSTIYNEKTSCFMSSSLCSSPLSFENLPLLNTVSLSPNNEDDDSSDINSMVSTQNNNKTTPDKFGNFNGASTAINETFTSMSSFLTVDELETRGNKADNNEQCGFIPVFHPIEKEKYIGRIKRDNGNYTKMMTSSSPLARSFLKTMKLPTEPPYKYEYPGSFHYMSQLPQENIYIDLSSPTDSCSWKYSQTNTLTSGADKNINCMNTNSYNNFWKSKISSSTIRNESFSNTSMEKDKINNHQTQQATSFYPLLNNTKKIRTNKATLTSMKSDFSSPTLPIFKKYLKYLFTLIQCKIQNCDVTVHGQLLQAVDYWSKELCKKLSTSYTKSKNDVKKATKFDRFVHPLHDSLGCPGFYKEECYSMYDSHTNVNYNDIEYNKSQESGYTMNEDNHEGEVKSQKWNVEYNLQKCLKVGESSTKNSNIEEHTFINTNTCIPIRENEFQICDDNINSNNLKKEYLSKRKGHNAVKEYSILKI